MAFSPMVWKTKGYVGQQADVPVSPERRDNLFESVPGNFEAHGRFDDKAHRTSPLLWVSMNRTSLLLGALAAVAVGAGIKAGPKRAARP